MIINICVTKLINIMSWDKPIYKWVNNYYPGGGGKEVFSHYEKIHVNKTHTEDKPKTYGTGDMICGIESQSYSNYSSTSNGCNCCDNSCEKCRIVLMAWCYYFLGGIITFITLFALQKDTELHHFVIAYIGIFAFCICFSFYTCCCAE